MISAADLKFLQQLPHAHIRNFKLMSGTGNIRLLVPLLFLKFMSEAVAMVHELRKRGARIR